MNDKFVGFIIGIIVGVVITAIGFVIFYKNDTPSFNPEENGGGLGNPESSMQNNAGEPPAMPSSSTYDDGNTITTMEDSEDY